MTTSMTRAQLQARVLSKLSATSTYKKNPLKTGFTLVELMVVIVIIGILSAVALPALFGNKEIAARNAARNVLATTAKACQAASVAGDSSLNPDLTQAKVPDVTFSESTDADCSALTSATDPVVYTSTPPAGFAKWTADETATVQPSGEVEYSWPN